MIKLENIATTDLYLRACAKVDITSLGVIDILNKTEVFDCQKLNDLIESGNPDFDTVFFKSYLKTVKKAMDKANELGHEPDIYIVDSYQDLVGDVEIAKDLKKVDWKVNGIELLYDNPLCLLLVLVEN